MLDLQSEVGTGIGWGRVETRRGQCSEWEGRGELGFEVMGFLCFTSLSIVCTCISSIPETVVKQKLYSKRLTDGSLWRTGGRLLPLGGKLRREFLLNFVLPKRYVEVLSPRTSNVTLFRSRHFRKLS